MTQLHTAVGLHHLVGNLWPALTFLNFCFLSPDRTLLNFGVQLRSLKLDQGIVVGIRHRIKWCHQESENEKDHFLSQHCLDR